MKYQSVRIPETIGLARCILNLVVFAEKHGYFAYSEYA